MATDELFTPPAMVMPEPPSVITPRRLKRYELQRQAAADAAQAYGSIADRQMQQMQEMRQERMTTLQEQRWKAADDLAAKERFTQEAETAKAKEHGALAMDVLADANDEDTFKTKYAEVLRQYPLAIQNDGVKALVDFRMKAFDDAKRERERLTPKYDEDTFRTQAASVGIQVSPVGVATRGDAVLGSAYNPQTQTFDPVAAQNLIAKVQGEPRTDQSLVSEQRKAVKDVLFANAELEALKANPPPATADTAAREKWLNEQKAATVKLKAAQQYQQMISGKETPDPQGGETESQEAGTEQQPAPEYRKVKRSVLKERTGQDLPPGVHKDKNGNPFVVIE